MELVRAAHDVMKAAKGTAGDVHAERVRGHACSSRVFGAYSLIGKAHPPDPSSVAPDRMIRSKLDNQFASIRLARQGLRPTQVWALVRFVQRRFSQQIATTDPRTQILAALLLAANDPAIATRIRIEPTTARIAVKLALEHRSLKGFHKRVTLLGT